MTKRSQIILVNRRVASRQTLGCHFRILILMLFRVNHINVGVICGRGSSTSGAHGGMGDSRSAAKIFLRRVGDKAQNPLTPKISFLLGFRPLYFGNIIKVQKIKGRNKNRNGREWFQVPDQFPLIALVGYDIGRSLLVAANKLFLALRKDRVPLEMPFPLR